MTREAYKNQARAARAIARNITTTDEARRQAAAAVMRVVTMFNGKITGMTTTRTGAR